MKKFFVVLAVVFGSVLISNTVQAQCAEVTIDNATDCDIDFKVAYTNAGPCGALAGSSAILTVLANDTYTYNPDCPVTIKAVKIINGSSVWVSYNSCNGLSQTDYGSVECNGDPIDINYSSQIDLVELSIP
jgi:hypothetical protein